jgi:hypothetical protein
MSELRIELSLILTIVGQKPNIDRWDNRKSPASLYLQ